MSQCQWMSDLQRDALSEIFNMGMGTAAASLCELLNQEFKLSVPNLQCLPLGEAVGVLSNGRPEEMEVIEQAFSGDFAGTAFLFFSEESGLELVRRMLGSEVALEELTEMENEALKEVSNIVLNACFGCMSNLLECDLESGIPLLASGSCEEILTAASKGAGDTEVLVMLLSMTFSLPKAEVAGNVTYLMTSDSMRFFLERIDGYIEKSL